MWTWFCRELRSRWKVVSRVGTWWQPCFRKINPICRADFREAERPFGRLLLQPRQEGISPWARAAAMGTEEGTDESENGKAELTTDRWLGSSGGRERSKDNRGILSLGGSKDGDAVNKNRQLRRWCWVERKDDEFCFAHTEIWRCFLFYLYHESSLYQEDAWVVNGLPRPSSIAPFFNGWGQDPSHFLKADFFRQTLIVLHTENIFGRKDSTLILIWDKNLPAFFLFLGINELGDPIKST